MIMLLPIKINVRRIYSLPGWRLFIIFFCFFLIGFFRLPALVVLPQTSLDFSWVIGLQIASQNHWLFGHDFLYTCGPLHFLCGPLLINMRFWVMALVFLLCIHCLLLVSYVWILFKNRADWFEYAIAGVLLLLVLPRASIDYETMLIAAMWLAIGNYRFRFSSRKVHYIIAACSIVLAIISLVKFNAMIISITILTANSMLWVYRKKYGYLLFGPFIYLLSIFCLWAFSGQQLDQLFAYISQSWNASSGYNSAMNITAPFKRLLSGLTIALVSFSFLFFIFIHAVRKKHFDLAIFLFTFSGFLFILFKHGFVRHDEHDMNFFSIMALFFFFLYTFFGRPYWNKIYRRAFTIILFLLVIPIIYNSITSHASDVLKFPLIEKVEQVTSAVRVFIQPAYRCRKQNDAISQMKNSYTLSEHTLNDLQGKAIDIFPWDIALLYAYGLKWSPRFTLQSFAAVTPHLDQANAFHFQCPCRPQRVLYSFKSVDGRYPAYDEPKTFACLLTNYHTAYTIDTTFVVLEPDTNVAYMPWQQISEVTATWGERVYLPRTGPGFLFAKVNVNYSITGKICNFFYKPPPLYITLTTVVDLTRQYRFVPAVARNGIFVSQFIQNTTDLASLFSGETRPENSLSDFSIDVENKKAYERWMYRKEIHIVFYGQQIPSHPVNL
jgi:hypothetical protein